MNRIIIHLFFALFAFLPVWAQTPEQEATAATDTLQTAVHSPAVTLADHNVFLLSLLILILIAIFLNAIVVFMEGRKKISARFARRISVTILLVTILMALYRLFLFLHTTDWQVQIYTGGVLLVLILLGSDALRNLLAGTLIAFSDHPASGDYICLTNFKGLVKKTGMQKTVLQNESGERIHIPNRLLITREWFGENKLTVNLMFYAAVQSDMRKIQDIIQEAARISLYINLDFEPVVTISQTLKEDKIWLSVKVRVWADRMENRIRLQNDLQARITAEFVKEKLIA